MGNCPGQRIPSNQPTLYPSRPLSRCLDSLPPHHLNPYDNSSLHHRNQWAYAFLHRLNGGVHVMGQQECVEGEWGESSLGVTVDLLYWSVLALCRELVWIPHLGLHICIKKSGIRLGLVCFSFKEVRNYLG